MKRNRMQRPSEEDDAESGSGGWGLVVVQRWIIWSGKRDPGGGILVQLLHSDLFTDGVTFSLSGIQPGVVER